MDLPTPIDGISSSRAGVSSDSDVATNGFIYIETVLTPGGGREKAEEAKKRRILLPIPETRVRQHPVQRVQPVQKV